MTDKTDKTDTPLTDEFMQTPHVAWDGMWTTFARDLERQLAFKTEQAQTLMDANDEMERQLAEARQDSERLEWLLSGYAICRWAAEDHSRNDEVLDSRQAIDAAIRRHLTPMEAERKFAQANKETGSTDEV